MKLAQDESGKYYVEGWSENLTFKIVRPYNFVLHARMIAKRRRKAFFIRQGIGGYVHTRKDQ